MAIPQQNAFQTQSNRPDDNKPKKGGTWLVVIIILVIIAILWPILRRDRTDNDTDLLDNTELPIATTTVSLSESELDSSLVSPTPGNIVTNQLAAPGAIAPAAVSNTMTVRAYFGNRQLDPQGLRCATVYPTARTVPRTITTARAALTELLKGPTVVEQRSGMFSSLNQGVKIQGLTIANGVARADFSQELGEEVGGSCLTAAIRAQITETLKQFPTVRSVVISINGKTEGILQP